MPLSPADSCLPRCDEPAPWFDPGWLIRRTLAAEAEAEPSGAAEDALLAWLIRLPDEHDPADAAARVLAVYRPVTPRHDALAQRLFELLDQTQRYPRRHLLRMHRDRRHRHSQSSRH